MAHCPPEKLQDLGDLLAEIRGWESVQEKGRGVFYVKAIPFLHFHVNAAGARWADARDGKAWGEKMEIAFGASAAAKARFLREARRRYRRLAAP
jgi:hypothetical protein